MNTLQALFKSSTKLNENCHPKEIYIYQRHACLLETANKLIFIIIFCIHFSILKKETILAYFTTHDFLPTTHDLLPTTHDSYSNSLNTTFDESHLSLLS